MNEFDKRLRTMAQAEDCPVPEGFEDRIGKQLEELKEIKVRKLCSARWVLIAACLCAALASGVLALNGLSGIWMVQEQSSVEESSYRMQADFGEWKLETMGRQLRVDLEAGTLQRTFGDRKSLEDYLGVSLIHSSVLEEAGIIENLEVNFEYGWDLRPELFVAPDARYVVTGMTVEGEEMIGAPEILKVTAHRVVENAEVFIDARIVTENADQEALQSGLLGEEFKPLSYISTEFVYDENGYVLLDEHGKMVVNETHYYTAEKQFSTEEYVMTNGLTATIVTATDVEMGGTLGQREYSGYFVDDGILYTVRPYAIYNPYKSFPSADSDMLIVLKNALDSFE